MITRICIVCVNINMTTVAFITKHTPCTGIDRGVQEWCHFICSHSACRVYVYDEENRKPKVAKQVFVNLRRNKRVQIPEPGASPSTVVTPDTVVDAYARRTDFVEDVPNERDGLLSDDARVVDFVRKYGYSPNMDTLFLLDSDAIVTIYPR